MKCGLLEKKLPVDSENNKNNRILYVTLKCELSHDVTTSQNGCLSESYRLPRIYIYKKKIILSLDGDRIVCYLLDW